VSDDEKGPETVRPMPEGSVESKIGRYLPTDTDLKHFLSLYKQYILTHLEFASPAEDKEIGRYLPTYLLKKVPEMAIRATVGLDILDEKETKPIGIHVIQTIKLMKGIDQIDPDDLSTRTYHSAGTHREKEPKNARLPLALGTSCQ